MTSTQQDPKVWTDQEDTILISLLHVSSNGFRSRGSQSWADIAATMTEQAPGYGIPILTPNDMYNEANVQARWYEYLRPQYEQRVVGQTARDIVANRERLKLAPLWEEFEYEVEPEKGALVRLVEVGGPPRFEELCKGRKGEGAEK
jgi:hypothetical protein